MSHPVHDSAYSWARLLITLAIGTVANVGGLLKNHIQAREDVHNAVLLNVGSVAYGYAAPVSAQNRSGAYVDVAANPNVAGYVSLRMNKGGLVHHGAHSFK